MAFEADLLELLLVLADEGVEVNCAEGLSCAGNPESDPWRPPKTCERACDCAPEAADCAACGDEEFDVLAGAYSPACGGP